MPVWEELLALQGRDCFQACLFDDLGQRREVERGAVFLADSQAVVGELLEGTLQRCVVGDDGVGEGGDRVGDLRLLRGVGDGDRVARADLLDGRSRARDVRDVRELEVPGFVLDRDGMDAGGDQVVGRDVADGTGGFRPRRGDARVAFGADAGFETDGGGVADFALPSGADFREVVGERVRVTGPVAAEDRRDRQPWQLYAWVDLLDLRIVPFGDAAEVDAGEQLARQVQFLHARNVESEAGGRESPRDLDTAVAGGCLFRGQRCIGGAVVDGPGGDLGDAGAGADGGVFDGNAFFDFEVADPVGHQGSDQRRAGARKTSGGGSGGRRRRRAPYRRESRDQQGEQPIAEQCRVLSVV